jgi:hypothetical protein
MAQDLEKNKPKLYLIHYDNYNDYLLKEDRIRLTLANALLSLMERRVLRMSIRRDPVEQTAEYKRVAGRAERRVRFKLRLRGYTPGRMGYCHVFWPAKKKVLREKYGIEWKSPAELNPDTLFD